MYSSFFVGIVIVQKKFFFYTISGALESLGQLMGAADTPLFAAEEAKKALIGLARDLRGLAYAFNTKTSYMMLFDWMYDLYSKRFFLNRT